MLSKRRDCRRRKCTSVLHGGVCHRTSTPHRIRNKMKGKKCKLKVMTNLIDYRHYDLLEGGNVFSVAEQTLKYENRIIT